MAGLKKFRPVGINSQLQQIEARFAQYLADEVAENRPAMEEIVDALEKAGSDSYISSRPHQVPRLQVLAFDFAWLTPAKPNTAMIQGKQVCYCVDLHDSTPDRNSWYARALNLYFGNPEATSLLTFPEVFRRKAFIYFNTLSGSQRRTSAQGAAKLQHRKVWSTPFATTVGQTTSTKALKERLATYETLVARELRRSASELDSNEVILAWVYVGPEASKIVDGIPAWGTSAFLVFRFRGALRGRSERQEAEIGVLLSNLLNLLRTVGPTTLGARQEKQNLAQALAHEFKNLTQDVALLSQLARNELVNLPPNQKTSRETELIDALHLGSQAVNAFCKVTYWLFSPKKPNFKGVISATGPVAFSYALALALRLLAPVRRDWDLAAIPTEEQILTHFRKDGVEADSLDALVDNFGVAFLLFMALEPVRNINKNSLLVSRVKLTIEVKGRQVKLKQETEQSARSSAPLRSGTIDFLMTQLQDYCREPLIEIQPVVTTRTKKALPRNRFLIERTTTFTVHRILPFKSGPS